VVELQSGYKIPKRLLSVTERRLFGEDYVVSEVFSVDGRDEDEYGHIFEWDELTDPIWTEGAYSIMGCIEFEPDCVRLHHDGAPVGFYMGGQAWVDPEHRGKGLGAKMIVACIAMSGRLPPVRDIGFSDDGFRAHENALAILNSMGADHSPSA
jgi:GNAT superfamily N-acetyltransferase